ncbi:MAG: hypothetical protein JSV66_13945 [Trueperaceae bacterium]|nr:MAG: hypothetical protein JSV66_13945 [Trueperaceae bacterium]
MLKLERVALELFEYKVEDIRAKRELNGGIASAWELFNFLNKLAAVLSEEEKGRLQKAGTVLKEETESYRDVKSQSNGFDALTLDADTSVVTSLTQVGESAASPDDSDLGSFAVTDPEILEEHEILQRLAHRIWWQDIEELVLRVAASWKAEREHYAARLIYGMLRNLVLYSQHDGFDRDVNVFKFRVIEPIPEWDSPLVSLNDLDSLAEIVREFIEVATTLKDPNSPFASLQISEKISLDYLRRFALAVAKDPYAGQLSPIQSKGSGSRQIRLAIQALSKERLRDDQRMAQRQELEHQLAKALAYERNQKSLFQRDVLRFTELVNSFFDWMAQHLPGSIGGEGSGPQLTGGILFGVNPGLRWENVPPNATGVTVKLVGPVRFNLGGLDIAVMGSGRALSLFVDGKDYALMPRLFIEVGWRHVLVFHEGDYLHLKVVERARSLAVLVAEALAVFFVLGSKQKDDLLTVLKVIAGTVIGEPQALIRRVVGRLGSFSEKAADRPQAIEGFVRGSAKAASVNLSELLIEELAEHFFTAMTVSATDLYKLLNGLEDADIAVHQLTGEPIGFELGGYQLTAREYRGRTNDGQASLVVMIPGQVLGSFSDFLITPLGEGTLIAVWADRELAVIYSDVKLNLEQATDPGIGLF